MSEHPIVDPNNVTIYNRTDVELEAFALFCACVAGKNSNYVANYVNAMVREATFAGKGVISWLAQMTDPERHSTLVRYRTGQYVRLNNAIKGLSQLDLRTCSLEQLLQVKGVGMKTSRFFLLHSRPDVSVAVLDTHILRWMRQRGVQTPPTTPTSPPLYKRLEKAYHHLRSVAFPDMTPAQADLHIWKEMRHA